MKKIILVCLFPILAMSCGNLDQIVKAGGDILNSGMLSQADAAAGIKQALEFGVLNGTKTLGARDGFLKNAAYQILMPKEVRNVEAKIRNNPIANALAGAYLDKVKVAMNRGAEKAMVQAKPIFVNAIRSMSISDAVSIVTGRDGGATDFLRRATTAQLTQKFTPIIGNSLKSVNIEQPWNKVSSAYNMIAGKKVNTNLTSYVTERAMEGLFAKIREEEHSIRANPVARTTDLLKRVFAFSGK